MKTFLRNEKGQVAIEYVMIIFISVACAGILTSKLIHRDAGSPGKIVESWDRLLKVIGNDLPDCGGQKKFDKAQCN